MLLAHLEGCRLEGFNAERFSDDSVSCADDYIYRAFLLFDFFFDALSQLEKEELDRTLRSRFFLSRSWRLSGSSGIRTSGGSIDSPMPFSQFDELIVNRRIDDLSTKIYVLSQELLFCASRALPEGNGRARYHREVALLYERLHGNERDKVVVED